MALNIILISQARLGSTRLPGKVLLEVDNVPLLKIHLDRVSKISRINNIILATTTNKSDDIIAEKVKNWSINVFRGSENDVLERYYTCACKYSPDYIVRVTADCPLIDPVLVDEVIKKTINENVDYGSNTFENTYPDGQDVEVFKFSALEFAYKNAILISQREHVTPFIRDNSNLKEGNLFSAISLKNSEDFSKIRMTVDEKRDFQLINKVILDIGVNKNWLEYTEYIINNGLQKINENIVRNEGYIKSIKND